MNTISQIPYNYYSQKPSFKANFSDAINEKTALWSIRLGKLDPNLVNKDGETMFQVFVKKNYLSVIDYITAKEKYRNQCLRTTAPNKKGALEYATTPEMKQLLISRGAKITAIVTPIQKEGAQEIASKIYVENPIIVKPVDMKPIKKQEITITQNSQETESVNKNQINYFDAFEEVSDEEENNIVTPDKQDEKVQAIPKKTANDSEEITKNDSLKPAVDTTQNVEKTIEIPKSFSNYSVLEISPNVPKKIDEIIGMDKIKEELKENVIIPLNEHVANVTLKANNIDIPNGILFETTEDTTKFIKALSNETKMPILQLFNPQELKPMLNDIETVYKKTGKKAIILVRGFDKFFTTGASCDLDKKNFLLTAENCGDRGALIIGTADEKCAIDSKFLSSGVFDKVLEIKTPDINDRKEYLKQYFKDKDLFKDLNKDGLINEIALKTEAFKYSDIEKVLEESARSSVANKNSHVDIETVLKELGEYTKQAGICPVDEFNKTTMYDTPEFKRVPINKNEIMKLDDLGGMPEIKEQLKKLYIEPFKNIEKLKEQLGSDAIPDGAIFYGPAGNGKTLTAKVLARELGLPFYETKLSDVASSYIHEVSRRIREMSKQLNDKFEATGEMSVWFFDEFDSLGETRDVGTASHKQEVTDTLLQELNNPSSKGYILIAATNDLDGIDDALKRRGRLGNWIAFSAPDKAARIDTIKKNLNTTPFTKELSTNTEFLKKAAEKFDGASMSSIVSVLNDAKRISILNNRNFTDCIEECYDEYNKRLMGEFCNKAGLKPHKYNEWDFKNLDELGGMEDVKQALEENIIDVWDPQIRAALLSNKRSLPGGVILEGPPGTGKTTIIETLAREMNVPLYKMNYSQEGNEYIHGIARNVTDIFNRLSLEAKILKKPVMLFFDEAEKFFPRYARDHQIEEVNTYKELMNTAAASGIILIAATNHIDQVNAEIIGNPRRMGTIIHCGNPSEKSRFNIFVKMLGDLPILKGVVDEKIYQELAELSEGLSIGQISDMLDKVITQAIKKRTNISAENLIEAFARKTMKL